MRRESRCPDECLRTAESGELGFGERGNDGEGRTNHGQEGGEVPERTRGPTLGICRATVGPQEPSIEFPDLVDLWTITVGPTLRPSTLTHYQNSLKRITLTLSDQTNLETMLGGGGVVAAKQ